MALLGSDLYALSQGTKNDGQEQCHWCGGKCKKTWTHDDPPPVPFTRTKTTAKCPSSMWVCVGCWLFRRPLTTMTYLGGGLKDRQAAKNHSLFITESSCNSVWRDTAEIRNAILLQERKHQDSCILYDKLLNPPLRFALALLDGANENRLQLIQANDNLTVDKDTRLVFTLNNQPQWYTVYELEEGIKTGPDGKEPGVQTLLRLLGTYEPIYPLSGVNIKRMVGRPSTKENAHDGRQVKKMVTPTSGSLVKA